MWAFLAVLLLVHNAAGSVLPRAESSIVGGEDAPEGRWPWMAYLVITTGNTGWSCGGSILTEEWILTAAHCVADNPMTKFSYVRLGTHSLVGPSELYRGIARFVVYQGYRITDEGIPVNDIAMMKVDEKIPFSALVSPVPLTLRSDAFTAESECWATGWGNVGYMVPLSSRSKNLTLQEVKVPLVENAACAEAIPAVTAGMICAGYPEGGRSTCHGDSGGPLVCRAERGFVQVGVVSFGYGCAMADSPAVYARVSRFLHFIQTTIKHAI